MGIFADKVQLWNHYRTTLEFRDRMMGPIPKDPKVIEGWLRAKAGLTTEEEVEHQVRVTLAELGQEPDPDVALDQLVEATDKMAKVATNGFKQDDVGLYIEGRAAKAMIKECMNILYASKKQGPTKKGAKSFVAERVFVVEDHIPLGVPEADGVEVMFGHVTGPQGPRSTVGYHEYVERPRITFHVMEQRMIAQEGDPPCLTEKQWMYIWEQAQEIGMGALRSQGHGRFDIVEWAEVKAADVPRPGPVATGAITEYQEEAREVA